ncbi:Na+/H+ antiporter subunit G [Corynebacterium aquilae]|uniref:Na+/H+ antiporter subunit G n=1 Tax=Corynebacterium aquilae TaxID=203263 RepID=UPI00095155BF|nr:Na+/H+ antiporter subunit G [Corynebacterium aquilae]
MSISEMLTLVPVLAGVVAFVLCAVAVWRAPDALSRANVLSIIPGVALPLMIMGKLFHDWSTVGFDAHDFVRAVLSIAGLLVVVSVASFTMGRSIYGVSVEDARIIKREQAARDKQQDAPEENTPDGGDQQAAKGGSQPEGAKKQQPTLSPQEIAERVKKKKKRKMK